MRELIPTPDLFTPVEVSQTLHNEGPEDLRRLSMPDFAARMMFFGKQAASLEEARQKLSIPFPEVGNSAVVTLAQKWITRHLPAAEIEDISTLASAVIGDKRKATQWLSEPNIATDNRAPIDLIGERDGYERVTSLLMRVEYGVLA